MTTTHTQRGAANPTKTSLIVDDDEKNLSVCGTFRSASTLPPDPAFLLEVRDNGIGISKANLQAAQSLGLLGMKERARLTGGEVTVARGEPGGTVVTVRIPFVTAPTGEPGG